MLALDTSTVAVTVALHDGATVVAETRDEGQMAHGELLAPAIAKVLAEAGRRPADLTDIVVGVGPGPFTGLRVGVVTALTLAHTLGLRSHGVCSLDPIGAEAAPDMGDSDFVVATDARRKEVYWARFSAEGRRLSAPEVAKPEVVAKLGLPVVGRGAHLYADLLAPNAGPLDPSAGVLASLVAAAKVDVLPVEPLYLRRPDVTVTATTTFA